MGCRNGGTKGALPVYWSLLYAFVHKSLILSASKNRFSDLSKYIKIAFECSFYATSFCFRSERIRIFVCECREYEGFVEKCIDESAPTRDERS